MTSRQDRTIAIVKKLWVYTPEELACRCRVTDRAARNWLNKKAQHPATVLYAIGGELWHRKPRPFPARRRAGRR